MKRDDIELRLAIWAAWVCSRVDNGMGFPRQCSYTRLTPRSGTGFIPGLDSSAWQVEQAVIDLKKTNPLLHRVIHVRYLGLRTEEQMLRACQCSRRTFYRRLADAKDALQKILDTRGTEPV